MKPPTCHRCGKQFAFDPAEPETAYCSLHCLLREIGQRCAPSCLDCRDRGFADSTAAVAGRLDREIMARRDGRYYSGGGSPWIQIHRNWRALHGIGDQAISAQRSAALSLWMDTF